MGVGSGGRSGINAHPLIERKSTLATNGSIIFFMGSSFKLASIDLFPAQLITRASYKASAGLCIDPFQHLANNYQATVLAQVLPHRSYIDGSS